MGVLFFKMGCVIIINVKIRQGWSENFRPFFRGWTGFYPFTRLYIKGSESV